MTNVKTNPPRNALNLIIVAINGRRRVFVKKDIGVKNGWKKTVPKFVGKNVLIKLQLLLPPLLQQLPQQQLLLRQQSLLQSLQSQQSLLLPPLL